MKENNRCSTLFHLLVPGVKCQTEIDRPVSLANFCNSNFQSRNREPLLPPPSAVTSNARAREYKALPWLRHHPGWMRPRMPPCHGPSPRSRTPCCAPGRRILETPPYPKERASLAAISRRLRSSSSGHTSEN